MKDIVTGLPPHLNPCRQVGVRGDGLPAPIAAPMTRSWSVAEAYAFCARLAAQHYENFPVGSWLIPHALRPHVHALYAFMRTADDFSDENRTPGDEAERTAYLAAWNTMLDASARGECPAHPIFIALQKTLAVQAIPAQFLKDLLAAFQMDVTIRRYRTFEDVLGYCRLSANPVGRLILWLFGYRDEERLTLSDRICTGLQLANHWQDVAIDLAKDRIYLPQEDLERYGVTGEELMRLLRSRQKHAGPRNDGQDESLRGGRLGQPTKQSPDDSFQNLMAFQVERTRRIFEQGRPLPDHVGGRLRWELRLTWHGGMRILEKIEARDYDVFQRRPVITAADKFLLFWRSVRWSA